MSHYQVTSCGSDPQLADGSRSGQSQRDLPLQAKSESSPVLLAAFRALDEGLSVVAIHAIGEPVYLAPVDGIFKTDIDAKTGEPRRHGPKVPCGQWKRLQDRQINRDDLRRALSGRPDRGLAVVSGYGSIDALDFDDAPTWGSFRNAAEMDQELADILNRIATGYFETSPRGAPHFLYRCEDLTGGGPLARRPEIVQAADNTKKLKVLIETRGPGQLLVVAPTPGTCHPTGRPYVLQRGGFHTIATITPDERRKLFDLARSFDQLPPDLPTERAARPPRSKTRSCPLSQGERPGEHFDRTCTPEIWSDMLAHWGWKYIGPVSGRSHCWVHPTATGSLSAHLTPANRLLVFSTSVPLAAWTTTNHVTHSPFYVYATIAHHGGMTAAARCLRGLGYGTGGSTRVRSWIGGGV